ncbi:hypothetical protein GCM10011428_18570 [Streptomyces violaceus]
MATSWRAELKPRGSKKAVGTAFLRAASEPTRDFFVHDVRTRCTTESMGLIIGRDAALRPQSYVWCQNRARSGGEPRGTPGNAAAPAHARSGSATGQPNSGS